MKMTKEERRERRRNALRIGAALMVPVFFIVLFGVKFRTAYNQARQKQPMAAASVLPATAPTPAAVGAQPASTPTPSAIAMPDPTPPAPTPTPSVADAQPTSTPTPAPTPAPTASAAATSTAKPSTAISIAEPYVGMSASNLNRTKLGKATKLEHITVVEVGGDYVRADQYGYYSAKGNLIFIAAVYDGKVVRTTAYGRSASGGSRVSGHSAGSTGDAYHTEEYSDPEEFYYWNRDDFADYEDAEDYYNSH